VQKTAASSAGKARKGETRNTREGDKPENTNRVRVIRTLPNDHIRKREEFASVHINSMKERVVLGAGKHTLFNREKAKTRKREQVSTP